MNEPTSKCRTGNDKIFELILTNTMVEMRPVLAIEVRQSKVEPL